MTPSLHYCIPHLPTEHILWASNRIKSYLGLSTLLMLWIIVQSRCFKSYPKSFKRSVFTQVSKILCQNDLLDPNQSGFKTGSTINDWSFKIGQSGSSVFHSNPSGSINSWSHHTLIQTLQHRHLVELIPGSNLTSHHSRYHGWITSPAHRCPPRLSAGASTFCCLHHLIGLDYSLWFLLSLLFRWHTDVLVQMATLSWHTSQYVYHFQMDNRSPPTD